MTALESACREKGLTLFTGRQHRGSKNIQEAGSYTQTIFTVRKNLPLNNMQRWPVAQISSANRKSVNLRTYFGMSPRYCGFAICGLSKTLQKTFSNVQYQHAAVYFMKAYQNKPSNLGAIRYIFSGQLIDKRNELLAI